MIIEPNSSEKFTGGDGQVWVSLGLDMQADSSTIYFWMD